MHLRDIIIEKRWFCVRNGISVEVSEQGKIDIAEIDWDLLNNLIDAVLRH